MAPIDPREVENAGELFAVLGAKRLPDGAIRVRELPGPWWSIPLAILIGTVIAGTILAWAYFKCDWEEAGDRYFFYGVCAFAASVWLFFLAAALKKTSLTFSSVGISVTRAWAPGLRLRRSIPWERVESVSMIDWDMAGLSPGLKLGLDSGKEVEIDWTDLPAGLPVLLPEILKEAKVPEQPSRMLLAALQQQEGVLFRDREIMARVPPPRSRGMTVVENSPDALRLRIRGGKQSVAFGCALMSAAAVGLIIIWRFIDTDTEGMPLSHVIAGVLAALLALAALYLYSWRQEIVAGASGLRISSGGWFWRRSREIAAEGASVRRDTGGFLDDNREHVYVEAGGCKVAFGSSLQPETRGWLEARLKALWGIQEVSEEDIDKEVKEEIQEITEAQEDQPPDS